MTEVRLAIIGCGSAARIHARRLLARPEARIVACVDANIAFAKDLAEMVGSGGSAPAVASDHAEALRTIKLDAAAIFTPHLFHYRHALDALQAGLHVFVEKPLTTNAQEAADIVRVAKARNRKVAVGHQFRLRPSLIEARRLLAEGVIGKLDLITCRLAQPWLSSHTNPENSWRLDPKVSGGGILADAGDHLLDALYWTTGQAGREVAAIQTCTQAKLDIATAASIRLADGTPVSLGISGISSDSLFELVYYGDAGRITVNETRVKLEGIQAAVSPAEAETEIATEDIDANFIRAIVEAGSPCCPAEEAVETVRLLEAISLSAASGTIVRIG